MCCCASLAGIRSITWSLGTCPGCRNVFDRKTSVLPSATVAQAVAESGLVWSGPTNGRAYYLTLAVTNNAGVTVVFGAPRVAVDTTPPVIADLRMETHSTQLSPLPFLSGFETVSVKWSSVDAESGVATQQLCSRLFVSTDLAPNAGEVVCYDVPRLDGTFTLPSFNATSTVHGDQLEVRLVVTSAIGITSTAVSPVVTVVWAAPVISYVRETDSSNPDRVDVRYSSVPGRVAIAWGTEPSVVPVVRQWLSLVRAFE
jgi:hypothetical protein